MSELNRRIELEALITEREGMRADNMLTASQKRPPAHGGLDFSVLAEQIRALAEPEAQPYTPEDVQRLVEAVEEAIGHILKFKRWDEPARECRAAHLENALATFKAKP